MPGEGGETRAEGGEAPAEGSEAPAAGGEAPAAGGETRAACVLRGSAERLPLTVEGLPDGLTVDGVPAEVTLLADSAQIRVIAPLAFTGRGEVADVRAHVATPVEGSISLLRGAAIRRLEPSDTGLHATAVLGGAFDVESEHWRGIALRMPIDCEHLALGAASTRDVGVEIEATHVLAGDQELPLRAGPDGEVIAVLVFRLDRLDTLRLVRVTEQRGAWSRVVGSHSHGSFEGWVEQARLGPVPTDMGPIGTSGSGSGSGCGRSDHPYAYRGLARVREGTVVRAQATGAAWAVVSEEVEAEVGVRPNRTDAEIIAIDGFRSERCGNLEFDLAMVPTDALILPAGAI